MKASRFYEGVTLFDEVPESSAGEVKLSGGTAVFFLASLSTDKTRPGLLALRPFPNLLFRSLGHRVGLLYVDGVSRQAADRHERSAGSAAKNLLVQRGGV